MSIYPINALKEENIHTTNSFCMSWNVHNKFLMKLPHKFEGKLVLKRYRYKVPIKWIALQIWKSIVHALSMPGLRAMLCSQTTIQFKPIAFILLYIFHLAVMHSIWNSSMWVPAQHSIVYEALIIYNSGIGFSMKYHLVCIGVEMYMRRHATVYNTLLPWD